MISMNRITLCFVSLYAYSLFNESSQYIFGGSEVRAVLFGVGLSKFPEYDVSFVVFDHQQPKVEEYGRVKVYRHSYYRSGEDHQCNVALTASLSSQARVDTLSGLGPGDTAPADVRRCKAAVPEYMRKARRELGLFIQKTPLAVSMAMLKALMRRSRRTNAQTSTMANGGGSMAAVVGQDRRTDTSDIYDIYKEIDADVYCVFGVNTFVAEVAEFCKTFGKNLILFIGSDIDLDLAYHNNDKYVRNIV